MECDMLSLTLTLLILISGLFGILEVTGVAGSSEVKCYSCSSDLDQSCVSSPSTTTNCTTTNGKGCATRIQDDGVVERGCSDIGLTPQGCQISILFGTECVCHSDRCNTGIPADKTAIDNHVEKRTTVDCYDCSGTFGSGCSYDISADDDINIKTCPAQNGCYLTKRYNDAGVMTYHRLCFEGVGPAAYYPGGCYIVFNDLGSTANEVCVCYEDMCNKNSLTALEGLREDRSTVKGETGGSNPHHSNLYSTLYCVIILLNVLGVT